MLRSTRKLYWCLYFEQTTCNETFVFNFREPLCKALGVKGTATIFTGVASQKCAEKAGFTTLATISLKDLADAGFKYPRDENTCIKLMVKSFV